MAIGNFGKTITFSVSADVVLTFRDMKRTAAGRWATHNIINKKPKKEFLGSDSQTVTMTVMLSAENGVKPRSVMKALRKACQNGTVDYLYIGGKKVCANKMYIESLSESWDDIWSGGELVRSTVSLTFAEYK